MNVARILTLSETLAANGRPFEVSLYALGPDSVLALVTYSDGARERSIIDVETQQPADLTTLPAPLAAWLTGDLP